MKLSLYFLFYVAMILELLIFIVERDAAEELVDISTIEMIREIGSIDTVKIVGTLGFKLGGIDSTTLVYYPVKLISKTERATVQYELRRTYSYFDSTDKEIKKSIFVDTSRSDGGSTVKVDTMRARSVIRDIFGKMVRFDQEMFLRCEFWRDPVTGDLHLKADHKLPLMQGRTKNILVPDPKKAFLFGAVDIQVKAILKRRFPDAVLANPRIVNQLKTNFGIVKINEFRPYCDSAVTRIEFKPTENVVRD